jgi:DNA replication and repair protein RecF
MQLNSLSISRLRNIESINLALNPRFNIFYGENGEGKTSLLEAVYVLTTGRSFRATKPRQIITFGANSCMVAGIACAKESEHAGASTRMGVERFQTGNLKIRLAEHDCHSIALLAKTLPVQLINSDSYAILEATPKFRRQFLDWATFHVEHSFYAIWQRFNRALQQRNAALKISRFSSLEHVSVWDKEFIEMGEIIDTQRRDLLAELSVIFSEIVNELLCLNKTISIQYQPGWNIDFSLPEELERTLERDKAWGYTTLGPQRADLDFLIDGLPAKSVLSRGQSKLFICALLMARATLLYRRHGRRCVFLIDDLNSELDQGASKLLVKALSRLGGQVLITSIEGEPLVKLLEGEDYTLFKIKGGAIV